MNKFQGFSEVAEITVTAILVFAPVSAFFYYAFKILNTLHAAGV